MVVVIIEAHFAPGDHARVPGELVELREMLFGGGFRVVRMNADRGVDPIVLLGERNRGIDPLRRAGAAADGQQRCDARRARAVEHRLAVFVELRDFQVRVRIDNFHGNLVNFVAQKLWRLESRPVFRKLDPARHQLRDPASIARRSAIRRRCDVLSYFIPSGSRWGSCKETLD